MGDTKMSDVEIVRFLVERLLGWLSGFTYGPTGGVDGLWFHAPDSQKHRYYGSGNTPIFDPLTSISDAFMCLQAAREKFNFHFVIESPLAPVNTWMVRVFKGICRNHHALKFDPDPARAISLALVAALNQEAPGSEAKR